MAISKLILNGEVQMDVTSDTVSANRMLNGYTATKNDGTKVTGNIATKSAADMTASGSTVTAAAGYYATATSKNVGAGSAFTPAVTITKNPTISLTSSTGAVTASYAGSSSVTPTVTAGYVAVGTAGTVSTSGTSTYQLTSKAAATYNTSTADQTVASYRWLTGTQTIKSVTTSNLTAANIASGVTVKVGDANNASRITQVTGTYAPTVSSVTVTPTETAQTFNATGVYGYKPVTVNAISSTYVGTGVDRRDGENTTFTQSTGAFYGPSGYYTEAFTRMITTQAAQTIYPSTADQTIASYRWLTGTQTFKSVTTTNLTAANIAEGVTVKVGDSTNASRITQITGTHSGAPLHTVTISGTGNSSYCYANYNGTNYYTNGGTFTCKSGDIITLYSRGNRIIINENNVSITSYTYTYTVSDNDGNITINLIYNSFSNNTIKLYTEFVKDELYMPARLIACPSGLLSSNIIGFNSFIGGLTSIPDGMFVGRQFQSGEYTFSNVTRIGNCAFAFIGTAYTAITGSIIFNFPKCNSVGTDAFSSMKYLTEVNMLLESSSIYIGNGAFSDCLSLTTFNAPWCYNISSYAFYGCSSLSNYNFTSCQFIEDYAFHGCWTFPSAIFPACLSIGKSAFYGCGSLSMTSFPLLAYIGSGAFVVCTHLSTISLPMCESIKASTFRSCYNLISLYLLGSSVVSLENVNAFSSTPLYNYSTSAGQWGKIYVPSSLYTAYQTAANWSNASIKARLVSV